MKTTPPARFAHALERHAPQYELELAPAAVRHLTNYYRLVNTWSARLHLVAPCTPEAFAARHVLESLAALHFMPTGARFIDVGAGAGLPSLPCLLARADLGATLVEASTKKVIFLLEAISQLGLRGRAEVRAERFERTSAPPAGFVTCRALERFTELLPQLVAWSPPASTLLLFGGPALAEKIEGLDLPCQMVIMPESDQRFLFVVERT